jgi:hypothetical protein
VGWKACGSDKNTVKNYVTESEKKKEGREDVEWIQVALFKRQY